jgi:hypothetical protein
MSDMKLSIEPPPASGINVWMLSTARKCQVAGLAAWEAVREIMVYQGTARRPFKTSEVNRAVEKAYNTTLDTAPISRVKKDKWEPIRTRRTNYRKDSKYFDRYQLWEMSPWRIDEGVTQRMILDLLFPDPDGLVCVGKSAFEFYTARLAQFKDLTQCQFIVPCYMSKKTGLTQDGKPSMHCLDNCGPRRFCVCDFDEPRSEEHPSIIWHLAKLADLVMVLSSGGKSLHAWFMMPEEREADFWPAAIKSGADPALMRNRSSFVRIPFGTRDNGNIQTVVYFDPSKIK